jgi:hypothetical protein
MTPHEQDQQRIRDAVGELARRQDEASQAERRQEGRVAFVRPVRVQTEDGREFTLLTRDLSPSGIRLIAPRSLLGQKVRVHIPRSDGGALVFLVRILWACAVGDDLFENGGTFLEVEEETDAGGGNGPRKSPRG